MAKKEKEKEIGKGYTISIQDALQTWLAQKIVYYTAEQKQEIQIETQIIHDLFHDTEFETPGQVERYVIACGFAILKTMECAEQTIKEMEQHECPPDSTSTVH